MGRIGYAVIAIEDDRYLRDIQESLAAFFDIGVREWGVCGETLGEAFVAAGIAREFKRRNPVYVTGKSALDLLRMVPEPMRQRRREAHLCVSGSLF